MANYKGLIILVIFAITGSVAKAQTYATGNYAGTGIAKSITGLGFSPECVIIKSSSAYEAVVRTSDMDAGEVKGLGTGNTACYTGATTSLDADGFTIGTGNTTNNASATYHWIAFNEGTNISVGTYAGNNNWSAEVVTGMGFSPDAILIWGDAAAAHGNPAVLLSNMGAGSDDGFFTHTNGTTAAADYINTWDSDGFTTGGTASSPIWSANYFYIAFNESGTTIKENSYSGNGADDRSVTDMGFQPDFTIVWSYNVGVPVFRHSGIMTSADKSLVFTATASASNLIQAFAATGLTVGNDTKVNSNSITHYYLSMSGGSALPVELTSFEAIKDNNNVLLRWQTASEINSDRFEIMHSSDGVHFETIGTIPAAGSSNTWLDYEFTHENPGRGIHYYQLVEFDQNGTSEKFKILKIDFNDAFNIITQLYPNPASNNLNLYYNSPTGGTYQLNIVDANGTTVYHAQIPSMPGENKFFLPLDSYNNGTYIITMKDPSNTSSSVTFIKQD